MKLDTRLVAYAHHFSLKVIRGHVPAAVHTALGGHPASYHPHGKAIDVEPTANAMHFLAYAREHPHEFSEVLYDPAGWFVKDGRVYKGSVGGVGDRVHIAVSL